MDLIRSNAAQVNTAIPGPPTAPAVHRGPTATPMGTATATSVLWATTQAQAGPAAQLVLQAATPVQQAQAAACSVTVDTIVLEEVIRYNAQ